MDPNALIEQETALRLLQALCFVWLGLVAGISFLEAPVKFTAPSLTRSVGLDVGRHVFAALNKVELMFAALALGLLVLGGPAAVVWWMLAGLIAILLVQTIWLLPALRAQAAAIIGGDLKHASSSLHIGYVALEVAKVVGLGLAGWFVG